MARGAEIGLCRGSLQKHYFTKHRDEGAIDLGAPGRIVFESGHLVPQPSCALESLEDSCFLCAAASRFLRRLGTAVVRNPSISPTNPRPGFRRCRGIALSEWILLAKGTQASSTLSYGNPLALNQGGKFHEASPIPHEVPYSEPSCTQVSDFTAPRAS
jgi:hypothetical protein